jgi:HlyD family secretion protein
MKNIGLVLVFAGMVLGCGREVAPVVQGYVEADVHYPAAPFGGRLLDRPIARGQSVTAGQWMASLDSAEEALQAAQLSNRLDQATARLADSRKGQRPEELAAVAAQVAQLAAAVELSGAEVERHRMLIEKGVIAQAEWDQARLAHEQNQRSLEKAQAQLDAARLGSRSDQIDAAAADWRAVSNQLEEANWRLEQRRVVAPRAGLIQDIYYEVGDWVPAGRPLVALLPPDARHARFYLPATMVASVRLGMAVQARTTEGAVITATIRFISEQPEYTPPVIYSRERHEKMVFLIEAQLPADAAPRFHPGQPVEIQVGSTANEPGFAEGLRRGKRE